MQSVMDILEHDMKDMNIVMDNCRIHYSRFVVDTINNRRYKPLFMPPYPLFLNPVEESKIKKNIKRNPPGKIQTKLKNLL